MVTILLLVYHKLDKANWPNSANKGQVSNPPLSRQTIPGLFFNSQSFNFHQIATWESPRQDDKSIKINPTIISNLFQILPLFCWPISPSTAAVGRFRHRKTGEVCRTLPQQPSRGGSCWELVAMQPVSEGRDDDGVHLTKLWWSMIWMI